MSGEVTFTLSAEDFVAANRDWWRGLVFNRGAALRYAIPVVIGFLFGAGVTMAGGADLRHSLLWGLAAAAYMIGLMIVLLALSYWLLGRRSRRLFGQQKSMHQPLTYAWSEQALIVRNAQGEGRYAWDHFHRWSDARSAILIFHTDNLFYIAPRRLIGEGDLAEMREMLERFGPPRR